MITVTKFGLQMKNAAGTFERSGSFTDNVLRVALKSRLKQHTDTGYVVNNRTININDLCVAEFRLIYHIWKHEFCLMYVMIYCRVSCRQYQLF